MGVVGAISAVGAGIKAVGSVIGGNKAKAAADYNASVSEQNAQQAEISAGLEEYRQRQLARKVIGRARGQVGASGIAASGSALDVIADSAAQAEMDAQMIRYRGAVQATNLRNQATSQRMEGSAAQTAGYISAASALTSGAYDIFARRA